MNARDEISALIKLADDDTRVALLRLAELFDEHLRDCPHVDPPVARPYIPTSHDEQVMVDRHTSIRSLVEREELRDRVVGARRQAALADAIYRMALRDEAEASVALDGETQYDRGAE